MGSFNTTCFASQQTIAGRDPCVVIPIIQAHGYEKIPVKLGDEAHSLFGVTASTCYPSAFWKPLAAGIECEYYDYGQVELIKTQRNSDIILGFISTLLSKSGVVEQGDNQYHDVPFDIRAFVKENTPNLLAAVTESALSSVPVDDIWDNLATVWDYIWEAAQEHRLFCADYKGMFPAQFAIMHRSAFDNLAESVAQSTTWNDESLAYEATFKRAFVNLTEITEDMPNEKAQAALNFLRSYKFSQDIRRIGAMEGLYYPGEDTVLNNAIDAFFDKSIDEQGLFERIKPLLELRYMVSGLAGLNLHFSPMVYASQDYSNEIGRAYAKFVSEVSTSVCEMRGCDEEEDEEEE